MLAQHVPPSKFLSPSSDHHDDDDFATLNVRSFEVAIDYLEFDKMSPQKCFIDFKQMQTVLNMLAGCCNLEYSLSKYIWTCISHMFTQLKHMSDVQHIIMAALHIEV